MPPSKHTSGEQETISSDLQTHGLPEADSRRLACVILTKADALRQRGVEIIDAGEVRDLIDQILNIPGRKSPKNGKRQEIILLVQGKINSLLSRREV